MLYEMAIKMLYDMSLDACSWGAASGRRYIIEYRTINNLW